MRPELLTPANFSADKSGRILLSDALSLAGATVHRENLESWTELEMAVAFDWAMRIHLHASDNRVKVRSKPMFVLAAEVHEQARQLFEWPITLGTDYGDQVVRCSASKPPEPGSVCRWSCDTSLGSPWNIAGLMDEITRHRATVPHEGDKP